MAPIVRVAGCVGLAATLIMGGPSATVVAQVEPELFSFPVYLDPDGDNFLALRSLPSGTQGVRLARLGPDTLFKVIGRQGAWVRVRLISGETGWVYGQYVGCCRRAVGG